MKIKKFAALFLVLALMLSLFTACGGESNSSASSTPKTKDNSESSDVGADDESSADDTGNTNTGDITWDTADLSWKKNTDPVTMTCYIDFDWYSHDTWGNDDVSKLITEETGVTLDVTKSSDLNQLQVLLAAGELPDLIFTTNQVTRFMDPEQCYPYDELINEYCPEFMQLIDPVELVNNTQDDGHFYTLRSHYSSASDFADPRWVPSPGDSGLYFRTDLMEEQKLEQPTSIEEFKAILDTAKEKYPDLVTYLPHPTWANPLCEFYGFTSPTSISYDGDNAFIGLSDPGFKGWLQFMNQLVQDGEMSVEAYTYEPEQFFQIVRSAGVFSTSYNCNFADDLNKNYYDANNIEAHMDPFIGVMTHDGVDEYAPLDAATGWAYFFISKNCKTPDRAINFVEYLKSPYGDHLTQWGIEGEHYNLNEDGLLVRTDYYMEKSAEDPKSIGVAPWYFMASGLGEAVGVSSVSITAPDYATVVELGKFRKEHYDRQPALAFTTPAADTDESVIRTKLVELWNNSQVGLYSATDFESAYNEFVANCEQIGINQLNDFYTEKFQAALKKYEDAGITF